MCCKCDKKTKSNLYKGWSKLHLSNCGFLLKPEYVFVEYCILCYFFLPSYIPPRDFLSLELSIYSESRMLIHPGCTSASFYQLFYPLIKNSMNRHLASDFFWSLSSCQYFISTCQLIDFTNPQSCVGCPKINTYPIGWFYNNARGTGPPNSIVSR